jgi:negative regulator of sigma E activity
MKPETHPIDKEQVMAYLDGELSSNDAQRVAAHLEACAECRELAAGFREVSARMLDWNIESSPAELTEGVNAAIERPDTHALKKRRASSSFFNAHRWRVLSNRWLWVTALGLGLVFAGVIMSTRVQYDKMASEARPAMIAQRQVSNYVMTPLVDSQDKLLARPMIARTASLNISVRNFDTIRASLDRIVQSHQGYVGMLKITSPKGGSQSLEATLRIPAVQFDTALADLKLLGDVEREQQGGEEVTAQVVDLDVRLKNARETETALTEVLRTRTGKIGDVLEVEKEMARVREEIERMEAEQKQLRDRVAFASINLSLTEEYQSQLGNGPSSAGRQIRNALVDGYHAAADGLLSVVVFFINVGPSLILWALILFWPARWAWRRWRKSQQTA